MKVYISVDFEGVAGSTSWSSTNLGDLEHGPMAREMTLEAAAACRGALAAGATEIYIKDAHESGRNMDISLLPKEAKIILGWKYSPDSMVCGLDQSFDALMFVGYHSPAGTNGSPLAHTMNRKTNYIKFNGKLASEFLMHAYVGASLGVPSVFISGDKNLCSHVHEYDPGITAVAVKEGMGAATVNLAPEMAQELIEEGAKNARKKLCSNGNENTKKDIIISLAKKRRRKNVGKKNKKSVYIVRESFNPILPQMYAVVTAESINNK